MVGVEGDGIDEPSLQKGLARTKQESRIGHAKKIYKENRENGEANNTLQN